MTWTGSSAGRAYGDLLPGLAAYLDAHTDLTLDRIMTDPPPRDGTLDVGLDGFAVLGDMIYRAGGLAALRDWLQAGRTPEAVLGAAARLLRVPTNQLDGLWRRRVAALAAQQSR